MKRIAHLIQAGIPFRFDGARVHPMTALIGVPDNELEMDIPDDWVEDEKGNLTFQASFSKECAQEMLRMLSYLGKRGNCGHSYYITVDKGDQDGERDFSFDGDGPDRLIELSYKNSNGDWVKLPGNGKCRRSDD